MNVQKEFIRINYARAVAGSLKKIIARKEKILCVEQPLYWKLIIYLICTFSFC